MTTLSHLFLFYGIVMIQIFTVKSEDTKPPKIVATKTFPSSDGMMGVASVAEITSKDGKVFSTGGVKFYSPTTTKLNKNANLMQPWTYSRKSSDGFAMGAVQIYPGAVVASATSYGNAKTDFGQMNPVINWHAPNNLFPQTIFSSRTTKKPVFPNYMFKDFDPIIPDFGSTWFQPMYDPFVDIWN